MNNISFLTATHWATLCRKYSANTTTFNENRKFPKFGYKFPIVDNLKTCFIYEEKGSWYNLSGNAFKQKALLKLRICYE